MSVDIKQFMPWLPSAAALKTPASRPTRNVANPVFLRLGEHTDDPFWKDIFGKLSRGVRNLPVTYRNGMLRPVNAQQKKKESYELAPDVAGDSLARICEEVIEFLQRNGVVNRKRGGVQPMVTDNQLTWKKLSSKFRRDVVLDYVAAKRNEYNLNGEETGQLMTLINAHILVGALGDEDFMIRDHRLHAISGLSFDQEARRWIFERELVLPATSRRVKKYSLHVMEIMGRNSWSSYDGDSMITEDS